MKVSKRNLQKLGVTFVKASHGIEEYRLDSNGLKIVIAENHASPVVGVMPLYRVGSRNEAAGHTGATHILEHMMFKGVKNFRTGEIYSFDSVVKPIGGIQNATTWFDRTNYFEVVPADALEKCIAAESDRLRGLVLNKSELDSEMTVVRNEMERGENEPSRVLWQLLYAHAFLAHTYHHPTIGWKADVEAITIERLRWFYDTFYWPNNTTLFVLGDVETPRVLELAAKYYGVHSRSPQPIPVVHTTEPNQEGERRFTLSRAGDAASIIIGYHVPEAAHSDTHALSAMAEVLGGGRKGTRLYKALIETGLAADVSASHMRQRDPGMFILGGTVAPGQDPAAVEAAIKAEIAKLAKEPPTKEELRRAQISNEKSTKLVNSDPVSLMNQLAEAEASGDWTFHVEDTAKLNAVTVGDVQRVANWYFDSENSTVGYFIPKQEKQADETSGTATKSGSLSKFAPRTQRVTLDNGMTLIMLPSTNDGVVGIAGKLRAGAGHAPEGKAIVPMMTAGQLTSGTTTKSAEVIASTMEEMGTRVSFSPSLFGTNFRSNVVNTDLAPTIALIADLLRNPTFPQDELDVARMQYRSFYEQKQSDTQNRANEALSQALYPHSSIYHQTSVEDLLKEFDGLTSADLHAFHKALISPKGMVLTFVGDFEPAAVVDAVKASFGDWTGPEVKPVEVGAASMPTERQRIDVNIPGKANASKVLGHPSILKRSDDDYFAAMLANAILGGDTISGRLGMAVRRDAGLTYGIYSRFSDVTKGGAPWKIELSVNPDNVEKGLVLIDKVLADYIKGGVTEKELSDEAGSASGTFVVQLRRSDSIAGTLNEYEFNGLGVAEMDSYATKIKSVTVDQVNAAIRKYLHPESLVTVVAGSHKKK